jgi:hypothetical protein
MKMQSLTFLFLLISLSASQAFSQSRETEHWGAYVQISEEADWQGNPEGAEAMLFIPIVHNPGQNIVFIDLRTMIDRGHLARNISVGMGYREVVNENLIVGVNGAIDHSETQAGNEFTQGQIGVEILMNRLELAANFYMPLGDRYSNRVLVGESFTGRLDGNFAFIDGMEWYRFEEALSGYDLRGSLELFEWEDFEFSAEGSYFNFGSGADEVEGYSLGLGVRRDIEIAGRMGEVGGYAGRREVFGQGDAFDFGVYFNIITGPRGRSNYVEREQDRPHVTREQLFNPVERNSFVITAEQTEVRQYTVPATITVENLTYDQITGQIDNSTDLFDYVNEAGENSLVVLDGERGMFILNDLLPLFEDQTLVGGGAPVLLTGPEGQQAIVILPGESAVVASGMDQGLQVTNNAQIVNITELKLLDPVVNTEIINYSFEEGHDIRNGRWEVFAGLADGDGNGWFADLGEVNAPIEIQCGVATEASDGRCVLELDSHPRGSFDRSNSHIYQDIDTEQGQAYRLAFDYSGRERGSASSYTDSNQVDVYWEGELIASLNKYEEAWETITTHVIANSPDISRLEFRGRGQENTYGGLIDNVRLEVIAAP